MKVFLFISAAVVAYLIGGVNPAIVLSNRIYHQDIRQLGSGNPGFTNFKRVYGNRWAWFVFALDIAKAVVVVGFFSMLFRSVLEMRQLGAAYTGFFAMIGHVFPIWYQFEGGKGFLVGAATIFLVDWRVGLIALAIMMVLLFFTKYMSLSVIIAALSCPIALASFGVHTPWTMVFCLLSVMLMVLRHRGNIERLIKGTERKFSLKG